MGDEIQLGQTEVCGDTKPSVVIGHGHGNHGHGHTLTTHNHHQHQHGVLVNTMQNYGHNMLETFKTEQLCQVQCMDCQKVRIFVFTFFVSITKHMMKPKENKIIFFRVFPTVF